MKGKQCGVQISVSICDVSNRILTFTLRGGGHGSTKCLLYSCLPGSPRAPARVCWLGAVPVAFRKNRIHFFLTQRLSCEICGSPALFSSSSIVLSPSASKAKCEDSKRNAACKQEVRVLQARDLLSSRSSVQEPVLFRKFGKR